MARILLSAYACEPGRGSEPGVGWSWATELPHLGHTVTVITRAANRAAIEHTAQQRPPNLEFVYYDLPPRIQAMRRCPGGKTLYYVLWQWFAVRHLRRTFPVLPFDVVHHVTYVSVRFPSFMGSLGIPFYLGPVSGGEAVPPRLRAGFSLRQRLREAVRDLSNWLVPVDPFVRRTFRQARRILVTPETLRLVPRRWRDKCEVCLAIGLCDHELSPAVLPRRRPRHPLSLLYAGRLLEWKGIDLAIRAVKRLTALYPTLRFSIAGDGPAKPRLLRLARELGLESNVQWLGWLRREELQQQYRAADVLLFPSLRDSGGLVALEALAQGLPVVCTDLGGPSVMVNDSCGRAVPTRDRSPAELVHALADAVHKIVSTPHVLESLSWGARDRARQFNLEDLALFVHHAPPMPVIQLRK